MKFFLPPAAIDQHIAILGKTGSGKTTCAKLIVEHVLKQRRQVCVLDPTAAWYGLRLGADGKSPGFDVVLLGGDHADIPLAERSGAAVARLVTEQGASVVIDTSGLTVGEYTRWFIDFAGTLYTTLRNPLHLVIDEAHYFMPQGRVPDPDAGRMLHAGNRLMSGGRSRGIRGMLITQRPAKLHKDALTCADTLIAMRVIAPQDRNAVKDWIDGCGDAMRGKTVLDSLAQLKRGEGWVWYPEGNHLEHVAFPAIATYDSSAAPVHGQKSGPKIAEIDLSEVRKAMAEAVKQAEASDPKLLRKKIAELEKELAKPAATTAQADPEALKREYLRGRDDGTSEVHFVFDKIQSRLDDTKNAIGEIRRQIGLARTKPEYHPMGDKPKLPPRPSPAPPRRPIPSPGANGHADSGGTLPKGERATLIACAQYPNGADRVQLSVITGYKRSSRDTYIQHLREKGFVTTNGDKVIATQPGIDALGDFEPLPTGEALQAHWLRRLPEGERRILEILIESYPSAVSREKIDEKTNYKRSSRDTYLQKLSAKKLVESSGRGEVRASEELFSE